METGHSFVRKLADVSPERLREALATASDPKAVKRLMIALSYCDGDPVDELSDRFGIPESTIYYWLDRFQTHSVEDAIRDERRPGRPSKLDDSERSSLARALAEPPRAAGYEHDEWTADLVRTHLESRYGVTYSEGHARRLLGSLGESEPPE